MMLKNNLCPKQIKTTGFVCFTIIWSFFLFQPGISHAIGSVNSMEIINTTNKGIFLTLSNTTSSDMFSVVVSNTTGTWYVLSTDPKSTIQLFDTPLVFVLGPYQDKSFDVKLSPGQKIGWHTISPGGCCGEQCAFEIKDYNSDGLDDYGFYSDDPMGFQILYTISK